MKLSGAMREDGTCPRCGRAASRLADLPKRVAAARVERGASMRDVAAATGLTLSTIHKAEHGGDVRLSTVVALLRWLDEENR